VSKQEIAAVSDEGARLLDFIAADATTKEVRFAKLR